MVTTEVAADDASRYGIVQVGDGERVTDYAYKPDRAGDHDRDQRGLRLHARTDAGPARGAAPTTVGEEELEDLGTHLLPAQTEDGLARAHPLRRLLARRRHRRRLLGGPPGLPGRRAADRPRRPGAGRCTPAAAGTARRGCSAGRRSSRAWSPAAPGWPARCAARCCRRGSVVEQGATVVDSVLLPGVRVRSGATVIRAVLDDGVDVGERRHGRRGRRHRARRTAVPHRAGRPGSGRGPAAGSGRKGLTRRIVGGLGDTARVNRVLLLRRGEGVAAREFAGDGPAAEVVRLPVDGLPRRSSPGARSPGALGVGRHDPLVSGAAGRRRAGGPLHRPAALPRRPPAVAVRRPVAARRRRDGRAGTRCSRSPPPTPRSSRSRIPPTGWTRSRSTNGSGRRWMRRRSAAGSACCSPPSPRARWWPPR